MVKRLRTVPFQQGSVRSSLLTADLLRRDVLISQQFLRSIKRWLETLKSGAKSSRIARKSTATAPRISATKTTNLSQPVLLPSRLQGLECWFLLLFISSFADKLLDFIVQAWYIDKTL